MMNDGDRKDPSPTHTINRRLTGILSVSGDVKTCRKPHHVKRLFYPLLDRIIEPTWVVTQRCRKGEDCWVVVRIKGIKGGAIECTIEQYLGPVTDDCAIASVSAICDWNRKINRMNNQQLGIVEEDLTPIRIDLSNEDWLAVSIDPPGCRDIDDCLSIRSGNFVFGSTHEVGIHIADPTSWFGEQSIVDVEAARRCSSVYSALPEGQMTHGMFPDQLQSRVFSLTVGRPVRAFSVRLTIECVGDSVSITNRAFDKTLIRVTRNTTYDAFQRLIDAEPALLNVETTRSHDLYRIGRALYRSYHRSIVDYDVKKMVEIYMILANRFVAERLVAGFRGTVYESLIPLRVQATPAITISRQIVSPTDNEQLVDDKAIDRHNSLLAQSAKVCLYSQSNDVSHYGLSAAVYTHFTSPIRRYVDILVHRLLYNLIVSETASASTPTFSLRSINQATIDRINHCQSLYRRATRYEQSIAICRQIQELQQLTIGMRGRVIMIRGTIGRSIDMIVETIGCDDPAIADPQFLVGSLHRIELLHQTMRAGQRCVIESFDTLDDCTTIARVTLQRMTIPNESTDVTPAPLQESNEEEACVDQSNRRVVWYDRPITLFSTLKFNLIAMPHDRRKLKAYLI